VRAVKWLAAFIAAIFFYFGASQMLPVIIVGTTAGDNFVRTFLPWLIALVVISLPVFTLGKD